MTPYETVKGSAHPLPFDLYKYQEEAVNNLAHLDTQGLWLDVGTGKTATSTAIALYKLAIGEVDQVLVLVPPILITGWVRWLLRIPNVSVLAYKGTPKARAQLDLRKPTFVVMSLPIFKRDIDRISHAFSHRKLSVLLDEAHSVKNVSSQNFRTVRDFTLDKHLQLLSGTPVTTPMDVYAYTRLLRVFAYKNLNQFENIHVAGRDFFGNVTSWKNLDLLAENMKLNSIRLLKQDVLKDLPEVTYTPLFYDLAPDHLKLYRRMVDEQLLRFGDGQKIDLTQATALFHALQQVVVNYDHFSGEPSNESNALELVEEVLDELGDRKLIIFSQYRMTNRRLLARYGKTKGAVALFGDIPQVQQAKNIDRFVDDPQCKLVIAVPSSAGFGIDRWQGVCSDVLFLESPLIPREFHQAVARVHRAGQQQPVNVRIAVAEETIQVRLHKMLLEKDALVNAVVRGPEDLRQALYGT